MHAHTQTTQSNTHACTGRERSCGGCCFHAFELGLRMRSAACACSPTSGANDTAVLVVVWPVALTGMCAMAWRGEMSPILRRSEQHDIGWWRMPGGRCERLRGI